MKLLETIRFENGEFSNLTIHQERMNNSRRELFGFEDEINLSDLLTRHKIKVPSDGLQKCRIIYTKKIERMGFVPYQFPLIKSLKIVNDDQVKYDHKYIDRSHLDKLFQKRGDCDDILIVKKGLVTDTWFANIIFFDGEHWISPENPLLCGTQRAFLINQGKIKTETIRHKDLQHFEKARLINAMIRFEDQIDIQVKNISG